MKKLFVCALAASMFTACSQDETVSQQSPMQISFANAFVNNATRAVTATDPSTTDESLTAFDVWGFMNNPSGVIFEGEDVTGSKGNFSYVNTQYWVANNKYYFAALAPMNMECNKRVGDIFPRFEARGFHIFLFHMLPFFSLRSAFCGIIR
jgi:hypothetical protein